MGNDLSAHFIKKLDKKKLSVKDRFDKLQDISEIKVTLTQAIDKFNAKEYYDSIYFLDKIVLSYANLDNAVNKIYNYEYISIITSNTVIDRTLKKSLQYISFIMFRMGKIKSSKTISLMLDSSEEYNEVILNLNKLKNYFKDESYQNTSFKNGKANVSFNELEKVWYPEDFDLNFIFKTNLELQQYLNIVNAYDMFDNDLHSYFVDNSTSHKNFIKFVDLIISNLESEKKGINSVSIDTKFLISVLLQLLYVTKTSYSLSHFLNIITYVVETLASSQTNNKSIKVSKSLN
jgi:hypothetical protein